MTPRESPEWADRWIKQMDTKHPHHDTDFPRTDPALDVLLDEAVSADTPPHDPDLAGRIYQRTLPMLGQRPVLARIGPTLLRVAAAVAIVVGGVFALTMMNQQPTQPAQPDHVAVAVPDDLAEQLGPELQAIANAIEPGNTRIDEQLDVLALRVDWVSTEGAWGAADQSTSGLIDQAVVRFEMDRFSDDSALYWADGQTLF